MLEADAEGIEEETMGCYCELRCCGGGEGGFVGGRGGEEDMEEVEKRGRKGWGGGVGRGVAGGGSDAWNVVAVFEGVVGVEVG